LPLLYANAFILQFTSEGAFILSVGQGIPPIVSGTDEEQLQKLMQIKEIPGKTVARIVLTPGKLIELAQVFAMAAERIQAMTGGDSDANTRDTLGTRANNSKPA